MEQLYKKSTAPKFIFVGGGVASGIGKGITISSIAYLLQNSGYNISLIKIDPYLVYIYFQSSQNIDAGTMAPREHGECYVLNDGGEVDLDLGNYERFLNINFTSDHNITSGKIFQNILKKERELYYKGKTVQFIPHVVDEIQEWITRVARIPVQDDKIPEIVLVELGGTVGDMENAVFYESLRQSILIAGRENIIFILITYLPQFKNGEFKSKPCQSSIKQLQLLGINADFIIVRSENPPPQESIEKIGVYGNMKKENVLSLPDYQLSMFEVSIQLEKQNINMHILQKIQLPIKKADTSFFQNFLDFYKNFLMIQKEIQIVLVGKYTDFEDCYLSMIKALESAAVAIHMRLKIQFVDPHKLEPGFKITNEQLYEEQWQHVKNSQGILIAGGYDIRGFEGKVLVAEYARINDIPTLGICFGFQCQVIEFSRNVLGIQDANSYEFCSKTKSENWVIIDMPDTSLTILGGTMRRGLKKTVLKQYVKEGEEQETLAYRLYKEKIIYERYRHRYEVNKEYIKAIEEKGMYFTGVDETNERMEFLELLDKKFYVGVQYHPEFLSRHFHPSPVYLGFLLAVKGELKQALENDIKLSKQDTFIWNKK